MTAVLTNPIVLLVLVLAFGSAGCLVAALFAVICAAEDHVVLAWCAYVPALLLLAVVCAAFARLVVHVWQVLP